MFANIYVRSVRPITRGALLELELCNAIWSAFYISLFFSFSLLCQLYRERESRYEDEETGAKVRLLANRQDNRKDRKRKGESPFISSPFIRFDSFWFVQLSIRSFVRFV